MAVRKAPLGIVAASGGLPVQIARSAAADGRPVHIAGLDGLHHPDIAEFSHVTIKWGQVGRLVSFLRDNGVTDVVIVGAVDQRPDIRQLAFDATAMRFLPKILSTMTKGGDDAVLRAVIDRFEEFGFVVVGAHEVDPTVTARIGKVAGPAPKLPDEDGRVAMRAATALGALDIGQGAVSIDQRVVAVEAAEGTDQMIERVRSLRENRRVGWKGRRGVLAKRAKPNQDLRVDMPVIGPRTVRAVAAAGLAGIVIEAERVMIVERVETVRLAEETGTYILAAATDPAAPGLQAP